MKKILLLVFTLTLLSSCANNGVTKNGYSIDKKDVSQIKIGVSNKESVLNILDYPTNTYPSNPNKWLYHSYKTKRFMFFKPKIVEQDVLIISFNNVSIVNNIAKYDLNDSVNINPANTRTPVDNRGKGLIHDILHNIGTINPGI